MLDEGNQTHNLISSSGSGTVINYGSDFLTSYGSGSPSQKVTVPTVPIMVPQHYLQTVLWRGNVFLGSVSDFSDCFGPGS
jgi:hypothetical protein